MIEFFETYLPNAYSLGWGGDAGWWSAIKDTLYMTFWGFVIGGSLGLIAGLFLVLTGPRGVIENRPVFWVLDKLVSVFRAIPFIILVAVLSGVTKVFVGSTIGATAALVPLSAATFPFFARQVQVVFSEMDYGVIEASQASGATLWDIVKVYLSEGLPELVRISTVTLISIVGETAMAGAIGAGGLGNFAIFQGYTYSRTDVTIVATVLILLIIFIIQFAGDFLTHKISHR
ncbi:methionine ABC transporter permease [Streptococcus dentasini]